MIEILATPNWKAKTTHVERWVEALESQGLAVTLERESKTVIWLEAPSLRLRGYVLMQGLNVEAIDFEVHPDDLQFALPILETAARTLDWELDDEPFEDEGD